MVRFRDGAIGGIVLVNARTVILDSRLFYRQPIRDGPFSVDPGAVEPVRRPVERGLSSVAESHDQG